MDTPVLLIDTAAVVPQFARLHSMTVSWLLSYEKLVCRHRLAVQAREMTSPLQSATLGYTLSMVRDIGSTAHFNLAINACESLSEPQPLFDVYSKNPRLQDVARDSSTPLAKKWGLWAPEDRLYTDAIRPTVWIMSNNPSLKSRAIFQGKLQATIMETIKADPDAGKSESSLARACGATRVAVRDALDHLELCRLITRQRAGHSVSIHEL
jgi:hypothetical protein